MKKIVLAYSGGLDTSIILRWLQENYKAEVIAYTSDIGQIIDKKKIIRNAKKLGVKKIIIENGVELIACGGSHTLFTLDGGQLWAMGNNSHGQLGDGTYDGRLEPVKILDADVTFIEARASNSIFVKKNVSRY